MVRLYPETDLFQVAKSITDNSISFGDEIDNTVARLAEIRSTAERFGLVFTTDIPDCWGGTISVTAYPSTQRHHWSF